MFQSMGQIFSANIPDQITQVLFGDKTEQKEFSSVTILQDRIELRFFIKDKEQLSNIPVLDLKIYYPNKIFACSTHLLKLNRKIRMNCNDEHLFFWFQLRRY